MAIPWNRDEGWLFGCWIAERVVFVWRWAFLRERRACFQAAVIAAALSAVGWLRCVPSPAVR
jgi:hypothetical protein